MNEIIRITGTENSLSQTCRLEKFKGEKEEILENSGFIQEKGIKELLCADSYSRKSYFLNIDQINKLNNIEKIKVDYLNFYSTDFRFDDYRNFDNLFSKNKGERELIVFTHEWILNPPMRKNILKYFFSLYRKKRIKNNINCFMKYCVINNYQFVSNFGGN